MGLNFDLLDSTHIRIEIDLVRGLPGKLFGLSLDVGPLGYVPLGCVDDLVVLVENDVLGVAVWRVLLVDVRLTHVSESFEVPLGTRSWGIWIPLFGLGLRALSNLSMVWRIVSWIKST